MAGPSPEAIGQDVASRACAEVGDDRDRFDHLRTIVDDACTMFGEARRVEGASETQAAEAMRRFRNGADPTVHSHIRYRTLSDDELLHDTHEMVVSTEEAGILLPALRGRGIPEKEWYRAVIAFRSAEVQIVPKVMSGQLGRDRPTAEASVRQLQATLRAENAADRSNRRSTEDEYEAFLIGAECSVRRAMRLFYGLGTH